MLADELATELWEMSNKVAERKISESTFRRKAKALLEAKTVNSPAQNRKVINDFLKVTKAERAFLIVWTRSHASDWWDLTSCRCAMLTGHT